jgi:hypothetical protein
VLPTCREGGGWLFRQPYWNEVFPAPRNPYRLQAYHLIDKLINIVFGDSLEFLFPFECLVGNLLPVYILGLKMKLGATDEKEKTQEHTINLVKRG